MLANGGRGPYDRILASGSLRALFVVAINPNQQAPNQQAYAQRGAACVRTIRRATSLRLAWPHRFEACRKIQALGCVPVLAALVAWQACVPGAIGAEPAASPGQEVAALIQTLDHPDYDARRRAREKLHELARHKDLQPILAEQFQKVLIKEGVSYEVRSALVELRRSLPAAETMVPAEVGEAEIERLLDELNNDSFAERIGAQQRLNWLLSSPAAGVRIMAGLKARLATDIDEDEAEAGNPGTEQARAGGRLAARRRRSPAARDTVARSARTLVDEPHRVAAAPSRRKTMARLDRRRLPRGRRPGRSAAA